MVEKKANHRMAVYTSMDNPKAQTTVQPDTFKSSERESEESAEQYRLRASKSISNVSAINADLRPLGRPHFQQGERGRAFL